MRNQKDLIFSLTKKDLEITFFSGQGAGGQHRNRHNNCVRIHHPESGVTVQATEHKSLTQNKVLAFKRLVKNKQFDCWLKTTASLILKSGKTINDVVEEQMDKKNLKIEKKVNGKWEEDLLNKNPFLTD